MPDVFEPVNVLNTDFRAGEVDPKLRTRVDAQAYASGCKRLRNYLITNTGAVKTRPGLEYVVPGLGPCRLSSFVFDLDESYLLLFTAGQLNIYDGFSGASVQTIASQPWTGLAYTEIAVAQAGNTAIICSAGRTKKLIRTSASSFTMSNFNFDSSPNNAVTYQPYTKYEDASVTLSLSALSGSGINVTASSAIFSADWVGDRIRIYGIELEITAYTSTTVVVATAQNTIEKRLAPNPLKCTDGSSTVEILDPFHGLATGDSVTISGAPDTAGITKANINGTFTITVLDEDRYTYTAGGAATSSEDGGGTGVIIQSTAATRFWDEPVYSDRRGWPRACAFHEDRLFLGGGASFPDGIFSSHTGDYFNFDLGDGLDSESIQVAVSSGHGTSAPIADVRYLNSNTTLEVFTKGASFANVSDVGEGLTPANIAIRKQSPYGVHSVPPVVFDGATIYLQKGGFTLREFIYNGQADRYISPNLSTVAPHLLDQVTSMSVSYGTTRRPEQYAFLINTDGTCAVFHSLRDEQLAAWTLWTLESGYKFHAVQVIDEIAWFVIYDGTSAYHLERIDMRPVATVGNKPSQLDHWESIPWAGVGVTGTEFTASFAFHQVAATKDAISNTAAGGGYWYVGQLVSDGTGKFTTDDPHTGITIGIAYVPEIVPLPPDQQRAAGGSLTGRVRGIAWVELDVYETYSLSVNSDRVETQFTNNDLTDTPVPLDGKYKVTLSGWSEDPTITVSRDFPLPQTLNGIVYEVIY